MKRKVAERTAQAPGDDEQESIDTILSVNGRLDLDEQGGWEYHGHSSGPAFLRGLGERFDDREVLRLKIFSEDPCSLSTFPQSSGTPNLMILPSRELACNLVTTALDDACTLLRFVHRPTFDYFLNRIYDIDPEEYNRQDEKFIPLLYMVLALGCLFMNSNDSASSSTMAICEGYVAIPNQYMCTF